MSKSPAARARPADRYQLRAARQKTAALLMPWFLERYQGDFLTAAKFAVEATDALLAQLHSTEQGAGEVANG